MSAKAVVTASMVYLGVLMVLAKGWLQNARSFIQNASGSA